MNGINNDTVTNVTEMSFVEAKHSLPVLIALSVGNIMGIVVGTTGNCLVVLVVIFNREMRSSTNLFIASLSVADFLVTGICMPIFFGYNIIAWPSWVFGDVTCWMVSYLVHVSVMASALSLLAISYDRFIFVYFPTKKFMTMRRAKCIICLIWLTSPFLLLPSALHHKVIKTVQQGTTFDKCQEKWETKKQLHAYQMYRVFFYFVFMAQISIVYFLIGFRIKKLQLPGYQTSTNRKKVFLQRLKVIKISFLVVVCFGLSWLPYVINKLLNVFPPSNTFKAPNVFVFVGNFLGLLNSCINPILYAALNRNFSKAFKNVLRCRWNYNVEERRKRVSEPHIMLEKHTTSFEGRHRDASK